MHGNFDGVKPVSRMLLIEEVEEIIRKAALGGGILRIGGHVKRLGAVHPGLTPKSIADELIGAAARAGIPIEMSGRD